MNAPNTPTTKPANKVVLPLVIAGALLLPMMGCGGLLMLGTVSMAMNGSDTDGPPPTMANGNWQGGYPQNSYTQQGMYSQNPQGRMYTPTNPYSQDGMPPQMQGQMGNSGEGETMPTPPQGMYPLGAGPVGTGGGGDMHGMPTYDARADTPGVNGFSEYIRDQSTIQDNNTGEVVRGVDNTVVQPLVDSGTASVVSSDTPATE